MIVTKEEVFLVQEYLQGPELFDKMVEVDHFPEAVTARVVSNLLSAVRHMHTAGIAHRDIKPRPTPTQGSSVFCVAMAGTFACAH